MKKTIAMLTAGLAISSFSMTASAWWWEEDTYTKTKKPIVLVHGLSGFDSVGGVLDYWYRIPYELERSGAKVYVASVTPFENSYTRGKELSDFLDTLPEEEFNLIGHSQGSPTSRVAAAMNSEKVASVTSVNGVNKGSKFADFLRGTVSEGSVSELTLASAANAVGTIISSFSGSKGSTQDALQSLETLSTKGTTELNNALGWAGVNPDGCTGTSENVTVNGKNMKFFSWSGDRNLTNAFDVTDPALALTGLAFGWQQNDGLVDVCSAKLGNVIGVNYELNHLDAVNQVLGARSIWTNPVSLFRTHANRLKNKGL